RRTALQDLRDRNQSPSLAQFVGSLLQAEELGAPLSGTLVELATEMRRTWAQQARRPAAPTAPPPSLVVTLVFVPRTMVPVGRGPVRRGADPRLPGGGDGRGPRRARRRPLLPDPGRAAGALPDPRRHRGRPAPPARPPGRERRGAAGRDRGGRRRRRACPPRP